MMSNKIFATIIVFLLTFSAVAQDKKTETFKVYGNCDMCKERIEGALKKKEGVIKRDWNVETKMLTVSYDPSKTDLNSIKHKVADAGYDSEDVRASDDAYSKLHGCCKYERPAK